MTAVALLARRHRLMIGAWLLLLAGVCTTTPAYESTYATPQQRAVAVAAARADAATTLIYGELPLPGRAEQMFAWEIGGIATILAAVFAVLLGVALTRATEDDGTLELVRGSGADPATPPRAALAVLGAVAFVLFGGTAAAAGPSTGALAFGAVLAMTFLLVGVLTTVLAQLAPAAPAARRLGFAAVGAAFGLRAVADVRHVAALNWLSPLGLRATVRPFTADRWWVLGVYLAAAAAIAALAVRLAARREYRAGLFARRESRPARLRVRSVLGLQLRLGRPDALVWTVATTALAALFTAMGSGVVEQSRGGDVGGFLGSQLGSADPAAGFCRYTSIVLALIVSAHTILRTLEHRHDEAAGRADLVLSTGVRRPAPLLAHALAAAASGGLVLLAAATVAALVAPATLGGPGSALRMFGYVCGQWPATAAMAGGAALLAGCLPRLTGLAWLPLAAGGTLALLGPLLGVPAAVADRGPFQQMADPAGILVLLAVAAAATVAGLGGVARRDLRTG